MGVAGLTARVVRHPRLPTDCVYRRQWVLLINNTEVFHAGVRLCPVAGLYLLKRLSCEQLVPLMGCGTIGLHPRLSIPAAFIEYDS